MTRLTLPVRVDIATGDRLPPSGTDPYTLRWVQGAISTVPRSIRARYTDQIADLREKLKVLRSRRAKEFPEDEEFRPGTGPRLRDPYFHSMQNRPLKEDGSPWEGE